MYFRPYSLKFGQNSGGTLILSKPKRKLASRFGYFHNFIVGSLVLPFLKILQDKRSVNEQPSPSSFQETVTVAEILTEKVNKAVFSVSPDVNFSPHAGIH